MSLSMKARGHQGKLMLRLLLLKLLIGWFLLVHEAVRRFVMSCGLVCGLLSGKVLFGGVENRVRLLGYFWVESELLLLTFLSLSLQFLYFSLFFRCPILLSFQEWAAAWSIKDHLRVNFGNEGTFFSLFEGSGHISFLSEFIYFGLPLFILSINSQLPNKVPQTSFTVPYWISACCRYCVRYEVISTQDVKTVWYLD